MPFKKYPDKVSLKLADERFEALKRLVDEANRREAHFFVVAGDLFDSTGVSEADVKRTVAILTAFAGDEVLVLPGNHDHFAGPETKVWKHFREETKGIDRVRLLETAEPYLCDIRGQSICFFPCPCRSKTGAESLIGWVSDKAKEYSNALRIGIAHGNVTGLGLDAEGKYFNMDPTELNGADMATWLLGHIHVPYPTIAKGQNAPYFMAGTHTPDSIRRRHGGSAWLIECEAAGVVAYEELNPGAVRFVRIQKELTSAYDIDGLIKHCISLDAAQTVLDLQLTGRLTGGERLDLTRKLDEIGTNFLHVIREEEIHNRIDLADVARLYPNEGLCSKLLTVLLGGAHDPDAATLAHGLIEEAKKR
jgi:DNA repair exonuclease SbcCD nuclease subunit